MFIYKITNISNNKIYIGQTKRTVEVRFKRHINDAFNGLETKIARAIRKYGKESFIVEKIDEAKNQKELDDKEIYWIHYYNSVENGYNMTDGAICANTYKYKTEKEMDEIKHKISLSKISDKNPNHCVVKCKNIETNEEIIFGSFAECARYFNEDGNGFVQRRCNNKTKYIYKNKYIFAYLNNDYPLDYTFEKNISRNRKVKIINLNTNEEKEFSSIASGERYFSLKKSYLSGDAYKHKEKGFFIKNCYKVTFL